MNSLIKIAELADKFAGSLSSKQYVYHIKSPEFKGKYIYPISELNEIDPELYKQSLHKYKGREEWIERKIPQLNCKATDVVNLSTINPIKLFIVEHLLNIESIDDKIIMRIPVSSLKKQECVLFSYDKSLQYHYKKQNVSKYKECISVPFDTVNHYIESKNNKENPLIFEYVPHLLVKGKVDISKAEIIKFKIRDIEKLLKP